MGEHHNQEVLRQARDEIRASWRRACADRLLLHTGPTLEWLAPGVLAAPWWKVL